MADTGKATIAAVVERLRTKASMIMLGEPIAWGSDSAVMDEAASLISALEAERDRLRAELEKAASALLAAEKRVREECAQKADKYALEAFAVYEGDAAAAGREIAAAIRKGGDTQ